MAWLRRVYETHPRLVSLLELLVFLGILVTYSWIVPFWFWGIYLQDIALPDSLSALFYKVWLKRDIIRAFLIAILICSIALSTCIRRVSLREMGIRTDNIWISGRECLYFICVILTGATLLVIIFHENLSIDNYFQKQQETGREIFSDIYKAILSGIAQQLLLQCFFLYRTLKIFRSPSVAIILSSAMFSFLHAPNVRLMIITMAFGAICSFLFLRNRNILTLGIMHGITQQILRVLFASIFISGSYLDGRGNYEYNLRVGPPKGYPEYLAELKYSGISPLTMSASGGIILSPVSVTNKSTKKWSSDDKDRLVFVSYRLIDEKGNVISQDSPLTPFDKPIEPGQSETVNLMVNAPAERGNYYAEVDIVQQTISGSKAMKWWFKRKGSKTILIPITVR